DVLVVVAAEDVEGVGRGDRLLDHRHRIRDRQRDVEPEVLLDALRDLRRRELDAEGDDAERPRELAALPRLRSRPPGKRADARDGGRSHRASLEELTAIHAARFREVAAAEILPLLQQLRVLDCIELVVHLLPSPFALPPPPGTSGRHEHGRTGVEVRRLRVVTPSRGMGVVYKPCPAESTWRLTA